MGKALADLTGLDRLSELQPPRARQPERLLAVFLTRLRHIRPIFRHAGPTASRRVEPPARAKPARRWVSSTSRRAKLPRARATCTARSPPSAAPSSAAVKS